MEIPRKTKIALGLGIYFATTITPNYQVHFINALYDGIKASDYPTFRIKNGSLQTSREHRLLMEHQRKSIEELTKPWLLIPGSFLWRQPERPNLENISEEKSFPERDYDSQEQGSSLISV